MMDIVERLRDLETKMPTASDNWIEARELQQEAAAEIERLREIEKDWQAMRDERNAARTGYDCLLGENRELVKLEVENERLRAENERMRGALTPSAGTKAAYMGEFEFGLCDGEYGSFTATVPWTTIKEIMAAIRDRAALSSKTEE